MKITNIERAWLSSIMEALIPPGVEDDFPKSALDTEAVQVFEEMVQHLPAFTGLGLRASILYIEFLGPLLGLRKSKRFSKLTQNEREQCLEALSKSDSYFARQMVLLHKSAACMGWGADPEVRAGLGYSKTPRFVKWSQGD